MAPHEVAAMSPEEYSRQLQMRMSEQDRRERMKCEKRRREQERDQYLLRIHEEERYRHLREQAYEWAKGLNAGVQGVPQPAHPKKSQYGKFTKDRLLLLLTSKE